MWGYHLVLLQPLHHKNVVLSQCFELLGVEESAEEESKIKNAYMYLEANLKYWCICNLCFTVFDCCRTCTRNQ